MDTNDNQKNHLKRLAAAVVLAVCVLGGAGWFWQDVAKERLTSKRWDVVEGHHIYRGGQIPASLVKKTLASRGIKVIV